MEVTRDNFREVLMDLEYVFDCCQFVAIDTEYTGLRMEGSTITSFDTLEDAYYKSKMIAESFMAIQIGITAFMYNEETNRYTHSAYNFYVYPSSFSNVNFTCQSSSIQFLVNHGLDFNKVFKKGIPYMKENQTDRILERLTDKYGRVTNNSGPSSRTEVPPVHQPTINNILAHIDNILRTQGKGRFDTERHNAYIRKLIYSSVEQRYPFGEVFLSSNEDETMTVAVGFTTDEIRAMQRDKFMQIKKEVMNEVGFCKVIKLLIHSKKPIVGHNLMIDILFIVNQFCTNLPGRCEEMKDLVRFLFPTVFDTKFMAFAELKDIPETSLTHVYKYLRNHNAIPDVPVRMHTYGHSLRDERLHEASYDAFLSGLCFLGMADLLGRQRGFYDNFRLIPHTPVLHRLVNKLHTLRLLDCCYMNLESSDPNAGRVGVYHVTFPEVWTRDNILDLFKNCGEIIISWVNPVSAYVRVKEEYVNEVEKNLKIKNDVYIIKSFIEHKNESDSFSDVPSSPEAETTPGDLGNNEKVEETSVNDFASKRKVEDIGEVIERTPKRQC